MRNSLLIIMLHAVLLLSAQAPPIAWQKVYGGIGNGLSQEEIEIVENS